MKLEDLFTPAELALIDAGEYRPGRAVLDAKLNLYAAIARESCAQKCDAVRNWDDKAPRLLKAAFDAGAAVEREACARFVEEGYVRQFENPWREDLAAAIRARGNK